MKTSLAAAASAAALAFLVWLGLYQTVLPPDHSRKINSLSYNFAPPREQALAPTEERLAGISRDLAQLAKTANGVRLYAASGIFEVVPKIAQQHGLSVTAGAWVGADATYNAREIDALVRTARSNSNIRSVVVGNETILREELKTEELISLIRHVRQRVQVPVTTGETWDIWLKHPELAREVDYISAHILPYWEGIPNAEAIGYVFDRYNALRRAFPGKRVVIAEFGWPSRGYNNHQSQPNGVAQANLVRSFLQEAHRRGIDYNIIEAYDQPWKVNEGSVGAYWGLYDHSRTAKFSLEGWVVESNHWTRAAIALAIGVVLSLLVLTLSRRRAPTFPQAAVVSVAAQALAGGMAIAALYPLENYLNPGATIAWAIGFALMIPLTVMTLLKADEVAEVTLGRPPSRLVRKPVPTADSMPLPKVSVHIPACRENPEILCQTLDSVAALDYPDFEVLVIVNNTPDEAQWRPVEQHCAALGERFKFVHLPCVEGFKAGALTAALPFMADDAEIIALLDADYVVAPSWLRDLVPAFADPKIASVQAPQDHRDESGSLVKAAMNAEYLGFFDIGMVQRNEDDAIITHGTMLLLRRTAFEAVGGWSSDTITEDTELGLRLFRAGWSAVYTNTRYGWGVLPDTFNDFKMQRDRWAYGAVQIIRKHWRALRPGDPTLSPAQKRQFAVGWSYWMADAIGVLAAMLNLVWVPMILFIGVLVPTLPFTVPILAMFAVNAMHCLLLYSVRSRLPAYKIVAAATAAMSLQLTVAVAVAKGLWSGNRPFRRTEKGGSRARAAKRRDRTVRREAWMGNVLAASALALHLGNTQQILEIQLFAATLLVQSLPFFAAMLMFGLEKQEHRRYLSQARLPELHPEA